jgi:hypothetical protein
MGLSLMNMLGLSSSVHFAHLACYWNFFLLRYTHRQHSGLYCPGTDRIENVSSIIACSLAAGKTTCPQSCSIVTAVVLSPVYTAVTWHWVCMSQIYEVASQSDSDVDSYVIITRYILRCISSYNGGDCEEFGLTGCKTPCSSNRVRRFGGTYRLASPDISLLPYMSSWRDALLIKHGDSSILIHIII